MRFVTDFFPGRLEPMYKISKSGCAGIHLLFSEWNNHSNIIVGGDMDPIGPNCNVGYRQIWQIVYSLDISSRCINEGFEHFFQLLTGHNLNVNLRRKRPNEGGDIMGHAPNMSWLVGKQLVWRATPYHFSAHGRVWWSAYTNLVPSSRIWRRILYYV